MVEIFSSIKGFTQSILGYKKMSQQLLTSMMTIPKESELFNNYIIDFIEIIQIINWKLVISIKSIKMRVRLCYLLNKFYVKNSVHLVHLLDKNEVEKKLCPGNPTG